MLSQDENLSFLLDENLRTKTSGRKPQSADEGNAIIPRSEYGIVILKFGEVALFSRGFKLGRPYINVRYICVNSICKQNTDRWVGIVLNGPVGRNFLE